MTAEQLRRLPGRVSVCSTCRQSIAWAVTVATPRGPGGKRMPLNPVEDPAGNVAVRVGIGGNLFCRVLQKDERHDVTLEILAMPHFATCHQQLGERFADDVETWLDQRTGDGL